MSPPGIIPFNASGELAGTQRASPAACEYLKHKVKHEVYDGKTEPPPQPICELGSTTGPDGCMPTTTSAASSSAMDAGPNTPLVDYPENGDLLDAHPNQSVESSAQPRPDYRIDLLLTVATPNDEQCVKLPSLLLGVSETVAITVTGMIRPPHVDGPAYEPPGHLPPLGPRAPKPQMPCDRFPSAADALHDLHAKRRRHVPPQDDVGNTLAPPASSEPAV